ncbi:transferase family-domain-containing protein [Cunninghamella echinulata]|nr:transferase family-domain-containing protein [Cunninghamella echinulata]
MNDSLVIDILGQQPMLTKLYTQISLCYGVSDESSYPTIVDRLTKGLEQLTKSFPWVAGKVDNGLIKPLHAQQTSLIVKDFRNNPSVLDMATFRQSKFPMRFFDETLFAPCNTLAAMTMKPTDDAPVFLIQVNYIKDGLILTFNGNHQAMDMIGQGQLMSLLSKACHQQPFTEKEITEGNISRNHRIPLLSDEEMKAAQQKDILSSSTETATTTPPPSCQWANFLFQQDALNKLKSIATNDLLENIKFISTDDAISAFIWQSITKVRLPRLEREMQPGSTTASTTSTFSRAVDIRRFFNLSSTYPGMIQNMTYHTFTLQQIKDVPLGHLASHLRLAVDNETTDLQYRSRQLATLLTNAEDKSKISVTSNLDASKDIMLSSWCKVDCYQMDFNLGLGQPEAVIRPHFTPVESLIYLLPKNVDGDIVVAICLRDEDMDQLKNDIEFTKYAHYIG